MNAWYGKELHRATGVVAVVAAAFLVVGCGADESPKADKPAVTTSAPQKSPGGGQTTPADEEPPATIATLKGRKGLELVINSVERDAGGFLTVKGRLANTGDSGTAVPAQVSGDETEVIKHGTSLGGATLIDSLGKKRYYVLRDTDGRPLTTSGLSTISAGDSAEVFMQFPAPPASTTEISFQLPTFEPATLKLS
ncbi:hypothetical protein EAO70_30140 [Streptomyces sp. adm13(2018)]|uniref:hypothetical protein n=1 Tax=Streptomyces sp. adm13(2018) TaxID=2479007 RepID=UPI0011CE88AC|nr:hypothetical protein [Streptomyces sp. adm13(2018)]TXS11229.1 hypothetical protein EAO70_30140 [Streptomyces sp. adm13(2018)]